MAETVVTNLQTLAPSRKAPKAGDIFVCRPAGRGYFFGRVVATDARIRTEQNCILLYTFATESDTKQPPERLSVMQLLIAPLMTNRLPWSRGYFETVARRDFELGERLPVHCFRDLFFKPYTRYWDEYNHELPQKREPCGDYGLHSYRTIDDAISDALGIPQVPD
jgi:immunity protein 26 of polymorphic toxin system